MQKLEELMEVSLFDRKKNRITLNENGRLLEEYAARLLKQEREMIERVRRFDRSRKTITSVLRSRSGSGSRPSAHAPFRRDDHRFRNPQQ